MTRNNREDAPLHSFLGYYAYKAEERKFYMRYPNQNPNASAEGIRDPITTPMPLWKAFLSFIGEAKMPSREYYISKKQYLKLDFLNEVPEIVCDVLYYLSGYVHFRSKIMNAQLYEKMLRCQISDEPPSI